MSDEMMTPEKKQRLERLRRNIMIGLAVLAVILLIGVLMMKRQAGEALPEEVIPQFRFEFYG